MALLWAKRSAGARRVFQNVLRLNAEDVRQRSQRNVAPRPAASKQHPFTSVLKSFKTKLPGKKLMAVVGADRSTTTEVHRPDRDTISATNGVLSDFRIEIHLRTLPSALFSTQ